MISVLAQITTPDVPWLELSPELILFGVGIIALLLDTAADRKVAVSFVLAVVLTVASGAVLITQDRAVAPALAVVVFAIAQLALTTAFRDRPRTLGAWLAATGFAGALGASGALWAAHAGELVAVGGAAQQQSFVGAASFLDGMFVVDGVALFTRFSVCLAGLVSIPLAYPYLEARQIHRGEAYPLLLFAATGMTMIASTNDLLMVFVAIEILSLSLYVLSGFARRDRNSSEAGVKYFLLGAFSSALLLYGIALLYGVTSSSNIPQIGAAISSVTAPTTVVVAGLALLMVGFGFKTALAPFHMWTPDVYQGAPTPFTGFMAAATKAAAFAVFVRIFVGAFAPLQWTWVPPLAVLVGLTMIVGAVLAVVQSDVKRILAYSSIAHAGYVAIGLVSVVPSGASGGPVAREATSAVLLYLLLYSFMVVGSFGVLSVFEQRARKSLTIADLRGIGRRYPLPSLLLSLFLISLAGIPGTAGFVAKFAVFRVGVDAQQFALVVIGVVSSVVAAFFYVKIIASMFVEEEPVELAQLPALGASVPGSVGLAVTGAAVLVLGILPGPVVELVRQAATFAT